MYNTTVYCTAKNVHINISELLQGTKNLPYEQSIKRKPYISGQFCYLIVRDVPHSSSSWSFDHITSGKEHKPGGV
jgi:hypothetical protein